MRKLLSAAFLGCSLLTSVSLYAETTSFDLDTDPGHYSSWKTSGVTATSVSFSATFAAVKHDRQYAPTYLITLKDERGRYITFKGFYLGSLDTPVASASSSAPQSNLGVIALRARQPTSIKLDWSGSSLIVDVDGKAQRLEVGFRPTEISISCSTGELKIANLSFSGEALSVDG